MTASSPRARNVRAGLTVLGATLAFFCSVGFLNAFGVFQEYYKADMLRDMSESDISWIGSVSIFLLYALAPPSGILVDRLGPTCLLIVGSVGVLLGVFLTSLCTQYYQLFLAQAVLLGACMALITWPPLAVVSRTLPDHRGLAFGVVVGGSSLGGIIWPIMLERLLNQTDLGFGWVMRIVGFTMLPLLVVACATVHEPPPRVSSLSSPSQSSNATISEGNASRTDAGAAVSQEKNGTRLDIIALMKNPVFILLAGGLGIAYLGLFVPFFYISSYGTIKGISSEVSFYLISALNGASLIGRVLPGYLADSYGHYNIMIMAAFASAITAFSWTAATSLAGLTIISIVYGFTSGAILALQSACVGKIASHHMQGTAMGLLTGCLAVTTLIGTPVGGAILGNHGYLGLSLFTGATLLGGSLLLVASRVILDRRVFAAV